MIQNSLTFEEFIDKKPLYYKEIDHKRVHQAYAILKPHLSRPQVIHVVGTNGKGSTGRIMATLLYDRYRVGHFSSPHILRFNERIWIDGEDISDNALEEAHQQLYTILGAEISQTLSYFEYTTLLSFVATQYVDILVLEAGLGGEFDATNVIEKELSVITPIGLDHQAFLGESIEEIAITKLNSIYKKALVGLQLYDEVYNVAKDIASKKRTELYILDKEVDKTLLAITEDLNWAYYLYENAKLALKALDILNLSYTLESLYKVELFGRFYKIAPNITIDVGHNLLATEALVKALDKRVVLIYNSLDDKDYTAILRLFKPLVEWVEIIDIQSDRAIKDYKLVAVLEKLDIQYKKFDTISTDKNYLVFGSFYTVEAFLNSIKYNIKNQ